MSTRDGKKARIDVSKTREEKDDDVVVALDKSKEMQKNKRNCKLFHFSKSLEVKNASFAQF